jgi:hypothetical protein
MATYEQRLTEFAQGRKFLRIPRPIRDRADALCDACGSTRPRTLYALEDPDSNRYFFVGETCLKELVKLGAILRYGRHSGQAEFEKEMGVRRTELQDDQRSPSTVVAASDAAGQEYPSSATEVDPRPIYPAIFIIETVHDYQAFAYAFPSEGDGMYAWGYARQERYQKVWRNGGENGLVLEEETVANPDAIVQSINGAWEEACSGRQLGKLIPDGKNAPERADDDTQDPGPFVPLPFVDSLTRIITALAFKPTESRRSVIDSDLSSI